MYRLVQEGLTNIRNHAPHTAVDVRFDGAPGEGLEVRVTNPLPLTPHSTVPGAGLGLVGLRERFALTGGRLEHGDGRRAGASGFLLKDTPPRDLIRAVRTVVVGDAMLSPSITRQLIEHLTESPPRDALVVHDATHA